MALQYNFLPLNIERTKEYAATSSCIGNDLLLTDFASIPRPDECRRMDCLVVALCLGGAGQYSLGGIDYKVNANDLIIVPEGHILGDVKMTDGFRGIVMLISHSFLYDAIKDIRDLADLFIFAREHPVVSLSEEETTMFQAYFNFMKRKVEDDTHRFRVEVTKTLISSMVYDLCNAVARYNVPTVDRHGRSMEMFREFIKLVELHFRRERTVKWYSEKLNVTPKTLLEMVKRASKRTPNEWLDIYTVMEARLLLRNTNMPIHDIAMALNFGTQSSLGKFFKEHTGVSPSAYRAG